MSLLLEEIKTWASKKTLAAHESLYLLGSIADENSGPSDLDILWISERLMPELWLKEIYVLSGLAVDFCGATPLEIKNASVQSHHPLAFIALALKHQALHLHGDDIRGSLSLMDNNFIKEVRSLQAIKEWMNYIEFKKSKSLRKVILALSVVKELIPVESGKSKTAMEKSFEKITGEYQDFYQSSVLTPEAFEKIHQEVIKNCYPSFVINRKTDLSWKRWNHSDLFSSIFLMDGQTIRGLQSVQEIFKK